MGAQPEGPLTLDAYLTLGVRRSIYGAEQRKVVHALFPKYRAFLEESGLYDPNLVAHAYKAKVEPRYEAIVVDEVQDLTNADECRRTCTRTVVPTTLAGVDCIVASSSGSAT